MILDSFLSSMMTRPAALIPFWKLGANESACAAEDAPMRSTCADLQSSYYIEKCYQKATISLVLLKNCDERIKLRLKALRPLSWTWHGFEHFTRRLYVRHAGFLAMFSFTVMSSWVKRNETENNVLPHYDSFIKSSSSKNALERNLWKGCVVMYI